MSTADQAVAVLKAMGLNSARNTAGDVALDPVDALKTLLLGKPEIGKLLGFAERQRAAFKSEAERLARELKFIQELAAHHPTLCAKGEHVTRSLPTGHSAPGHVVTRCLCCDYTEERV